MQRVLDELQLVTGFTARELVAQLVLCRKNMRYMVAALSPGVE